MSNKIIFNLLFLLGSATVLQAQAVQATLLGTWDDPSIPGSSFYDNRYNEIWGHEVNGREFAIIGSTMGTHFIDVTNPEQPEEIAFAAGKFQGPGVVHRDYRTSGDYIYAVCDEGPSSLQIFDMSEAPDTVYTVYDSDELVVKAHNCWVDTVTNRFYIFAGNLGALGYAPMAVFDLSDPVNPQYIKKFGSIGNFPFGHVHDGFVRDDIAYLNCGYDGFCVADFSDPANPVLLGTMTSYQGAGYNHAGWPTEDQSYYFLADENHGQPLKTVDISDYSDIHVVATYNADSHEQLQIPHNPIVACDYLYVSYYYDGLQVYDISDPENVERVLYYDTYPQENLQSYKGAWGVYPFLTSGNILVSDMQTGLYVFQGLGDNCIGGSVSVETPENLAVSIYPQPASEQVIVEGLDGFGRIDATILSLDGKIIKNQQNVPSAAQIQLELGSEIPAGMYFLQLRADNQLFTRKLLIH